MNEVNKLIELLKDDKISTDEIKIQIESLLKTNPNFLQERDFDDEILLHKVIYCYGEINSDENNSFLKIEEIVKFLIEKLVENPQEKQKKLDIQGKKGSFLHYAAKYGNINIFKILVEKGADLNKKDGSNRTPASYAVTTGKMEIVKYLLETLKLDINAKYKDGESFLHYAAAAGQLEIVDYLLQQGALIDIKQEGNFTPLYYAVHNGYINVVRKLLSSNANINEATQNNVTLLDSAFEKKYIEIAFFLICNLINKINDYDRKKVFLNKYEEYFNIQDHEGRTILHWAILHKNEPEVITNILLASKEINFEIRDNNQKTPLMLAYEQQRCEIGMSIIMKWINKNQKPNESLTQIDEKIISFLKENQIDDINIQKANDLMCLRYSIHSKDLRLMRGLLQKEAEISNLTIDGQSLLEIAIQKQNIEMILFLVKKLIKEKNITNSDEIISFLEKNSVDLRIEDVKTGRMLLHQAVLEEDINIIQALLKRDINSINMMDRASQTALYFAIKERNIAIIKILIDNKAYLDIETLKPAIENGDKEIVKILIDKKAIQEKHITAFFDLKIEPKHIEIMLLFIEEWINQNINKNDNIQIKEKKIALFFEEKKISNIQDANNKTLLHYAAESGYAKIVQALIKRGADQNLTDNDNNTPLHYATQNEHKEVVELLVKNNAKLNIKNKNNKTVPELAIGKKEEIEAIFRRTKQKNIAKIIISVIVAIFVAIIIYTKFDLLKNFFSNLLKKFYPKNNKISGLSEATHISAPSFSSISEKVSGEIGVYK